MNIGFGKFIEHIILHSVISILIGKIITNILYKSGTIDKIKQQTKKLIVTL